MGGRGAGALGRAALALGLVAGILAPGGRAAAADRLASADPAADAAIDGASSVEDHSFYSAALERPMPYIVYTPPGYARTLRRYPVLYMLHGMGGSDTQWKTLGLLDTADALIRARAIAPLIIVLPQGDGAYWMDHTGSDHEAWGTYTTRDVVHEIDSHYRTIADRTHRAIGGLSMGAHGAMQLALNHPDLYGVAGAHSLVLRRIDQAPPYFGAAQEYARRDPLTLVARTPDAAGKLALWVDIGDRDPWTARTYQFEETLALLGVEHEWHAWPGDHSARYWSGHVADYLAFYDRALRGSAPRGLIGRAPAEMISAY